MLEENIVVNELTDTLKLSKKIYIFNIIISINIIINTIFLIIFRFFFNLLIFTFLSVIFLITLFLFIFSIKKINKIIFIKEKNRDKFKKNIYYIFSFLIYFLNYISGLGLLFISFFIYYNFYLEYLYQSGKILEYGIGEELFWSFIYLVIGYNILLIFYIILSIISLFFYKINYIEITKEEYDKLK